MWNFLGVAIAWIFRPGPDAFARDVAEADLGLDCAFTEDRVDWPRLLGALYELSLNKSHSVVMISSAQLQIHLDSDIERDLESDGCFIGLFTLRLVVVLMTLQQDKLFLEGIHDDRLQRGFERFLRFSMVQVMRSPFAFSLFEALHAYTRKVQEMCPLLDGPPVPVAIREDLLSPNWATLQCIRSRGSPISVQIPTKTWTPWCGVQEPNPPAAPSGAVVHIRINEAEAREVLVPLWEHLQVDLNTPGGKPSSALVAAAAGYFDQDKFACAEVEIAAVLVFAWAKLISYSQAMMVVDEAIRVLRFTHTIFTRWPVWKLLGRLAAPPLGWSSGKNLQANTCLHFEACKRTVAFYRRHMVAPKKLEGIECPAPSPKLRFTYRGGVLRLRSNLSDVMQETGRKGIFFLPELRLFDLSNSLQRMAFQASLEESKKYVKLRDVSVKDLPLKLGWEGVQITSQYHSRRHGDTFLDAQRLPKLGRVTRDPRVSRVSRGAGVSVYFLVLESASRAAFEAYCPLTMAFLRQQRYQEEELRTWRVSDLALLHSLFSGTAANMLPALSGFSYDQQRDSQRRATWDCHTVLEGVPEERLIWNVASAHGYTTLFGASGCNGILGTRHCRHYLNQFDRVVPSLEIDPNCFSQKEWHQTFADRNGSRGCVGEKRPHQHLLDYILRFQEIHADVPVFTYLHLETTHDSQEALQLLDKALVEHLKALARLPPEALPVIVLAGDHGPATACDESFPLATMLMPEVRFPDAGCGGAENCGLHHIPKNISRNLNRHYQDHAKTWRRFWWNLEQNRFMITSWFDMYATFWHLITGKDPGGRAQNEFESPDTPDHWAQSLLVRGSKERTCTQAGVPLWHCSCARSWVGWCPISHRGQVEVGKRALEEAQNFFETEAAKLRIDTSPRRLQRLEKMLGCELQLDSVKSLEEKLQDPGGRASALLRFRLLTDQGMEFQFFASISFHSKSGQIKDLDGVVEEVFKLLPRSPYGPNEKCTPMKLDPGFCACADQAELRNH